MEWRRGGRVPDVGMRKVPVSDRLCMVDVYDIADDAVDCEEAVEEQVVRAVAEDVADRKNNRGQRGRRYNIKHRTAVFKGRRERLLTEDVQAQRADGVNDLCWVSHIRPLFPKGKEKGTS